MLGYRGIENMIDLKKCQLCLVFQLRHFIPM